MKIERKIWRYARSHMWCSFAVAIFACMISMLIVTACYLKEQYYTYLMNFIYTTEDQLINSVEKNMEIQLSNYINMGAGICVDEEWVSQIISCTEIEEAQRIQSNLKTESILKNAIRNSNSMIGVAVADAQGILCQYDKNRTSEMEESIWDKGNVQEVFKEMVWKNSNHEFPRYMMVDLPKTHPNTPEKTLVHFAFPLRQGYSYENIQNILLITYDMKPFSDLLKQLNVNEKGYIQGYIEGRDGKILLHTETKDYVGMNAAQYAEENKFKVISEDIGKSGWKLHVALDEAIMKQEINAMYRNTACVYVITLILILNILFLSINHILKPVNLIRNSIAKLNQGNEIYEQIVIGKGKNEIWQLAEAYNEMLEIILKSKCEVEEQHRQIIKSMQMQQKAEREALESQINAHFICNTINVINYEAIESGNFRVSILLKKLSNILRYTFDQRHQDVYMLQEITWIRQYLFLQRERRDKMFDYEIDFDPDYDNWSCRKLMLQPFVENAILHGFVGKDEGGFIRISGEGFKEFLKLTIEDNGCGMNKEKQQIVQRILDDSLDSKGEEAGIGISNVVARMRMHYGSEMNIQLDTREGIGTRFVFILPMVENSGGGRE